MGRIGFRGRTRRYAFLLVRARSGVGVRRCDTTTPDPHALFFGGFPRHSRHRVPDLSAYATKMRVPLLRALQQISGSVQPDPGVTISGQSNVPFESRPAPRHTRGAAAAGDEIDTPLGYFLYEISCDQDPDHISVLARLPSEEAVMRLRELLRME
jgi:hypothetical protein